MMQHHAARNFIDVCPPAARGADELLVDVLFANPGLHAREHCFFFVGGDRKSAMVGLAFVLILNLSALSAA